jgi:hypothetical protein
LLGARSSGRLPGGLQAQAPPVRISNGQRTSGLELGCECDQICIRMPCMQLVNRRSCSLPSPLRDAGGERSKQLLVEPGPAGGADGGQLPKSACACTCAASISCACNCSDLDSDVEPEAAAVAQAALAVPPRAHLELLSGEPSPAAWRRTSGGSPPPWDPSSSRFGQVPRVHWRPRCAHAARGLSRNLKNGRDLAAIRVAKRDSARSLANLPTRLANFPTRVAILPVCHRFRKKR